MVSFHSHKCASQYSYRLEIIILNIVIFKTNGFWDIQETQWIHEIVTIRDTGRRKMSQTLTYMYVHLSEVKCPLQNTYFSGFKCFTLILARSWDGSYMQLLRIVAGNYWSNNISSNQCAIVHVSQWYVD